MAVIIGVRFKNKGKVYYFDPGEHKLEKGSRVVVETTRGLECGEVMIGNTEVDDSTVVSPLKPVVRPATKEDLKRSRDNEEKEKRAFGICQEKIAAHKLEMKLVDVEYAFDNSKILFYFTADGRVDFRELVKDLASVFFCCSQFLGDFQPVSIKMAKEQGLSLNPTKISGSCGRLMCCLKYEQEAYESLLRITPKNGAVVTTKEGKGVVTDVSLLTGVVKVRLDKSPDSPPVSFRREEVKVIRDNRIKVAKEEQEKLRELEEEK